MAIETEEATATTTVVTFPANPSDADIDDFLHVSKALIDKQTNHAFIVDMSKMLEAAPNQRSRVAEFIRQNREALARYRRACAFVVSSPFARGVITAIMWVQRPPYPFVVVGTRQEAQKWTDQKLAALG